MKVNKRNILDTKNIEVSPNGEFLRELFVTPLTFIIVLLIIFFLNLFSPLVVKAQTNDDPSLAYEQWIYDIYRQFSRRVIPLSEWRQMAKRRNMNHYGVQKDDNLWQISSIFFGSGHYWPKVWSFNGDITNPHQIEPGKLISFYSGTLSNEPAFSFFQGQEAKPVIEEPFVLPKEVRIIIPSPIKKPKPVLRIPPSLPASTLRVDWDRWKESVDLSSTVKPRGVKSYNRELTDYLLPKATIESVGRVVEMELTGNLAGLGQYIFVQGEGIELGSEYIVEQVRDRISLPDGFFSKGSIIQVQGMVRVMQIANQEENIYRALVTYSANPIELGSYLNIGRIESYSIQGGSRVDAPMGEIIGGQYDGNRKIFGEGGVVFIDMGKDQGLDVGALLPVVLSQKSRNPDTEVNIYTKTIGLLKLIKVFEKYSTAVVIRANDQIAVGEAIGGGFWGNEKAIGVGKKEQEQDLEFSEDGLDDDLDLEEDLEIDSDSSSEEGSEEGLEAELEEDLTIDSEDEQTEDEWEGFETAKKIGDEDDEEEDEEDGKKNKNKIEDEFDELEELDELDEENLDI